MSGIINPNYHFGNRLTHLMESVGIDTEAYESADRVLAEKLFEKGIIQFKDDYQEDEAKELRKRDIDRKRKTIMGHRKKASATSVRSEWIDYYCQFFGCDADYLFGYIDTPTRESTDICKATGLSEKSVKLLLDRMAYPEKKKAVMDIMPDEERFKEAFIDLNKNSRHIPIYLLECVNFLLEYCYEDKDSESLIDLIYKYLSSIPVKYMHVYSRIQGDKRERIYPIEAPIRPEDYISTNYIDEYKISELFEETQRQAVMQKLIDMKRQIKEKEEDKDGKH